VLNSVNEPANSEASRSSTMRESCPWFMPKDEPRLSSEVRVCLGL
jgi:hypothetical protein